MLEGMQNQGNTPLLIRVKTYTATFEINMVVPQKAGNQPTSRSSYTISKHIPKGLFIVPQGHMYQTCQFIFKGTFECENEWSLTLLPAFGTLSLLLVYCVQLQYNSFALSFYIVFCRAWLLSLRNRLFSIKRQKGDGPGGKGGEEEMGIEERDNTIRIQCV